MAAKTGSKGSTKTSMVSASSDANKIMVRHENEEEDPGEIPHRTMVREHEKMFPAISTGVFSSSYDLHFPKVQMPSL